MRDVKEKNTIFILSHNASRIMHYVVLALFVLVIWSLVLGAYLEFGAWDLEFKSY